MKLIKSNGILLWLFIGPTTFAEKMVLSISGVCMYTF